MSSHCRLIIAGLILGVSSVAGAQTLDPPFSDHAVIQRGKPVRLKGRANPGEAVQISFAGQHGRGRADAQGYWAVELHPLTAGGPYRIEAKFEHGDVAVAEDVMVGDVWLCAGQSNMELPVDRALDSGNEVSNANDSGLRLLTVPHLSAPRPDRSFRAKVAWQPVTPASVGGFSAACYYMVRELRRSQRIPIGAIGASWGATPIRAWLDEAGAASEVADEYSLLALHRRDVAAANRAFGESWGAWWRKSTGDQPGQEPWQGGRRQSWSPVPSMTYWENWGDPRVAEFNGMVWFRKRVSLAPEEAAQGATIALTVIDEQDQLFVNGTAVGGRYSWEVPRNYRIPPELLRAGENEILVNVFDSYGAGGMRGPANEVMLTFADGKRKPIGDGWEYSIVSPNPGSPPQSPWDEAMGLTAIYNGMIAPFADYGLKGVAWYQGETDVDLQCCYAGRLAALMAGWRRQFLQPDLPFLIVGLANFGPLATKPVESRWAALREQQRIASKRDPHSALVVAMDLGERTDIHPANKQEVGRRLARAAGSIAYGSDKPVGPEVVRARREDQSVVLEFKGVTGSLRSFSGARLLAFELCGDLLDSCRFADAVASGSSVRIALDGRSATRVRYAWAGSPVTNLYDEAQLPVGPFEIPVD